MSEPTPPRGSDHQQPGAGREETRAFAAPVPPQRPAPGATPADNPAGHPAAAGAVGPTTPITTTPSPRRGRLLMGAAAAGLLGAGVVVGVVVGQATAGSAAADTGSSTTRTVPGSGGLDGYGTPPDGGAGGMPPGGFGDRGRFGMPDDDGTTDDGTTDDGTTGGGSSDGGTGPTTDGTTQTS
jgi:hypothetical protein